MAVEVQMQAGMPSAVAAGVPCPANLCNHLALLLLKLHCSWSQQQLTVLQVRLLLPQLLPVPAGQQLQHLPQHHLLLQLLLLLSTLLAHFPAAVLLLLLLVQLLLRELVLAYQLPEKGPETAPWQLRISSRQLRAGACVQEQKHRSFGGAAQAKGSLHVQAH
jgi:phosphatidylserine synthase